MGKSFVLLAVVLCVNAALAWGPGHDTTVHCLQKCLPLEFVSHLKTEWIPLWEEASHLPDAGRHELLNEPDRSFLEQRGWRGMSLHKNELRVLMFDRLVAAIRRDDWHNQFVLVAALSHVNADPAACNHNPIVQCASYIWGAQGLCVMPEAGYDFGAVEETERMSAVLARRLKSVKSPVLPVKLGYEDVYEKLLRWQYEAIELCNGRGSDVMKASVRRLGGDPTAETDLAEALCDLGLYSVERTWWTYAAAKRLADEKADPPTDFDLKALEKKLAVVYDRQQLERPFGADGYLRDCLPLPGRNRIRVLNDPTANHADGILSPTARILGPQTVCSLRHLFPFANASLIDLREVAQKGLEPKNVDLLVVPGSSFKPYLGFDHKKLLRQIAAFAEKGGRVLWINGALPSGVCDAVEKAMYKPYREKGGYCNPPYWVPMRELVGSTFAWTSDSPVAYTCVRRPTGMAGWFWEGSTWAFDPKKLPADSVPLLEFRSPNYTGTVGVAWPKADPRFIYLPYAALFPYTLTHEKPSVTDYELRLDSAGEAFLSRAVRLFGIQLLQ